MWSYAKKAFCVFTCYPPRLSSAFGEKKINKFTFRFNSNDPGRFSDVYSRSDFSKVCAKDDGER